MPNKNTQFNNSFNNDDKPSCFVIDLKQQAEEGKAEKNLKVFLYGQVSNKVKDFYYNLKKFIRCNYSALTGKIAIKQEIANLAAVTLLGRNRLRHGYKKHEKKFNKLAFFFLFKYLFLFLLAILKWSYKLCHGAGWLAVFAIRFVWLAVSAVGRPIARLSNKISFLPVKTGIIRLFRNLSFCLTFLYRQIRRGAKINLTPAPRRFCRDKKVGRKFKVVNVVAVLCERLRRGKMELSGRRTAEPSAALSAGAALRVKGTIMLRSVLFFAIILLILVLPFKAFTYYKDLNNLRGKVLATSGIAINELAKAGSSAAELQLGQASQNFSSASDNFLQARNELNKINDLLFILASYAPNENLKLAANAKHILAAGQAASDLGKELSLAMDGLFSKGQCLADILNNFNESGSRIVEQAKNLKEQLAEINVNALPTEYREQFNLIKNKAIFLEQGLGEFVNLTSKIQAFLGIDQDERYLLVFQNNTEMRASGGFIGSYALVDFSDGKIKNIEAPGGGSYDTEAGLYERIISPEPLHLVNPLWHFWDANWWPDWEKSAKKLMSFYEKSGGSTVDGVIAFTPTVIEKILAAIGPIDMSQDYGVIIGAENFWLTTQGLSEQKPDETKEPKKIIGDLMAKIIDELPGRLKKDNFIKLIAALEESLSQKHILFYFTDDELQNEAADLGWTGKIKQTNWDYLMVVNTNIAGGKSDKKIKEVINHSAEALEDGTIINTVEIKRTHTGIKREPFCGARNVNWIRVYTPIGSELIEARGFDRPDEIYFEEPEEGWQADPDLYFETTAQTHWPSGTKVYDESWKTVFANWTMVDPGETITIYLKYKLPFKLEKTDKRRNVIEQIENYLNPEQKLLYPYALLAQKQSGSIASEINSTLKLPDNFNIVWQYPDGLDVVDDGWSISDDLYTDKYWAVILEMQN